MPTLHTPRHRWATTSDAVVDVRAIIAVPVLDWLSSAILTALLQPLRGACLRLFPCLPLMYSRGNLILAAPHLDRLLS
jgi:hypothetical protein